MQAPSYQSSRFTQGNFLFPDRLRIEQAQVVFTKRSFFSIEEECIPFDQIASVSVQRGLIFANLLFETTGGSEPIFVNGFWVTAAEKAKALIQRSLTRETMSLDYKIVELLEEQNKLLQRIAKSLEK